MLHILLLLHGCFTWSCHIEQALRRQVRQSLQLSAAADAAASGTASPVGYVQGLSDAALFLRSHGQLSPRQVCSTGR